MPSPTNNQYQYISPRPRHRFGKYFSLLVWFGLIGFAAIHHLDISDWLKLHSYQPPATISQLATQDTMTDYGRKVFYVNQPMIYSKASFGTTCPDRGKEQTIVLGCYHGGQAGIYLLKVDDPRLNGVVQVTAAHEMLHAAYDRLNKHDRDHVNSLLEDFYKNDLKDPRIISTIEAYKKSEPNDVVNEMHSVFGTEIVKLPAQLEAYYTKYFTNRSQVANFAAQYQSEFTTRQAVITQDDAQLASLKNRIDQLEDSLRLKQSGINNVQANLRSLRNSNQIEAYNAEVPEYNRLVNSYNADLDAVRGLIEQYNSLVAQRNAVASETDQLTKELTSNQQPINN